ncbi:MAG TPA: glycosyltransferase, partial [Candidatus Methanoperedens sp.]
MRILQVTDTFVPSNFGGVKLVSYNISKALAKKGHELTVYTTDANAGPSRLHNINNKDRMDGFGVRYFKNISNSLAFKNRLFIPLGVIPAVRKEIRDFDVIHLHSYRSFQHIIVHYYAVKYGIPYVLQAHGSVLPSFSKERSKNLYDQLWGFRILKNASMV